VLTQRANVDVELLFHAQVSKDLSLLYCTPDKGDRRFSEQCMKLLDIQFAIKLFTAVAIQLTDAKVQYV